MNHLDKIIPWLVKLTSTESCIAETKSLPDLTELIRLNRESFRESF